MTETVYRRRSPALFILAYALIVLGFIGSIAVSFSIRNEAQQENCAGDRDRINSARAAYEEQIKVLAQDIPNDVDLALLDTGDLELLRGSSVFLEAVQARDVMFYTRRLEDLHPIKCVDGEPVEQPIPK